MFADWRANSFLKSSGALASPFGASSSCATDEKLTAFLELVAATRSTGAAAGWVVPWAFHAAWA
jgi:hypothetical protein